MVPKVFVSSTFYDLKYVRETIGTFIEDYGFEPIISESGDIGYTFYQPLDRSCYDAMKASDMAILIIGGRYGSPASGENMSEQDFTNYKSVTRREFETAHKNNVPIYVFIEAPVFYEYETYKKNIDIFKDGSTKMQFASIDNINIFHFISEIYSVTGISVWSFSKLEDIKEKLKKQWASLFLKHLSQMKMLSYHQQLEFPINQLDLSIRKIAAKLDKLVEKDSNITPEDNNEIEEKQLVESVASLISNTFEFATSIRDFSQLQSFIGFFVEKLLSDNGKNLLELWFSDEPNDKNEFFNYFNYPNVVIIDIKEYILFQPQIFDIDDNCKELLVSRLMSVDCLGRMNLVTVK